MVWTTDLPCSLGRSSRPQLARPKTRAHEAEAVQGPTAANRTTIWTTVACWQHLPAFRGRLRVQNYLSNGTRIDSKVHRYGVHRQSNDLIIIIKTLIHMSEEDGLSQCL
jgi:hypothetical protein